MSQKRVSVSVSGARASEDLSPTPNARPSLLVLGATDPDRVAGAGLYRDYEPGACYVAIVSCQPVRDRAQGAGALGVGGRRACVQVACVACACSCLAAWGPCVGVRLMEAALRRPSNRFGQLCSLSSIAQGGKCPRIGMHRQPR